MGEFKDKKEFEEVFHRYNKDKPEIDKVTTVHGSPIRLFVSKEKVVWRFADGYILEVNK